MVEIQQGPRGGTYILKGSRKYYVSYGNEGATETNNLNARWRPIYIGPRGGKFVLAASGRRVRKLPKGPGMYEANEYGVIHGPRNGVLIPTNFSTFTKGYRKPLFSRRIPRTKNSNENTGNFNFRGRPIMRTKAGKLYVPKRHWRFGVTYKSYKFSTKNPINTGKTNYMGRTIYAGKSYSKPLFTVRNSKTGRIYRKYIRKSEPTAWKNVKGRTVHQNNRGKLFIFTKKGTRRYKYKEPNMPNIPRNIVNKIMRVMPRGNAREELQQLLLEGRF